jgi:hypothetical protein
MAFMVGGVMQFHDRLRRVPVLRKKLLPLLVLPLLVACSDQRAAFEIDSSQHSLTLIRVQNFFWQKTAVYSIVAARMPECMRRHEMGTGSAATKIEVYAPGNDAWILKQGRRMFVVETRTCAGFARLEEEPVDGLGPVQGSFELRSGGLVFVPAARGGEQTDALTPTPARN